MSYDVALRAWVSGFHPLKKNDRIEIEPVIDSGYCDTCGPDNYISVTVNGKNVRRFSFYDLGDVLREIFAACSEPVVPSASAIADVKRIHEATK